MKDTFYFSHDYNARSDDKIKKLIRKHGLQGYGLYWSVIEDLYSNANALHLDYEGLAFDYRVDKKLIESLIEEFDLFIIEGDNFSSKSVGERLSQRNEKSAKARESAKARWGKKNANALQTQSNSNAIKERKVKESKINKNNNSKELLQKNEISKEISSPKKKVNLIDLISENFSEEFLSNMKNKYNVESDFLKKEGENFVLYWTEKNPSGNKEKWQMEKTFDVKRRFYKRLDNGVKWSEGKVSNFNNGTVYTNEI